MAHHVKILLLHITVQGFVWISHFHVFYTGKWKTNLLIAFWYYEGSANVKSVKYRSGEGTNTSVNSNGKKQI